MKTLITALLVAISLPVLAVEVTAQGSGTNLKSAIQDAKNNALEQVTGAFVVNQSETDGRRVKSKYAQYSGGVVRKYEMVSSTFDGQLYEVTINADVDARKENGMISPIEVDLTKQSQEIQQYADRYENVDRIFRELDSRKSAFVAVEPKIQYLPRGEMTEVRVTTGVKLQPKWVDDVLTMSKQAGSPMDITTSTSDVLWGVGVALAPFNLAGSSIIRSAAQHTTRQPKTYMASNCFSKNRGVDVNECYATGYMMGNVVRNDRFLVMVTLWSGNEQVYEMPVAIINNGTLFAIHDEGSKLYFSASAKERKFQSRGVVWFTDGLAIGTNAFMVNTKLLARVDRMEYILR